jgi:Spy/CpxP family protein refolding chaperone
MRRFRAIAGCAIAIAVACLAGAPLLAEGEKQAAGEKGKQQQAGDAKGGKAPAPIGRARTTESVVWWNSPGIVRQLTLGDEQRAKMDGHLDAYRKTSHEASHRTAFSDSLAAGDWKEARTLLKQLEDQAVTSIRARGQLKINVLSVLSEDQRKTLVENYRRRLINQQWKSAMRMPEQTEPAAAGAEPSSE